MVKGVEELALQATQAVKQTLEGEREQAERIKLERRKFFLTVPLKTFKHFKHAKWISTLTSLKEGQLR